MGQHRVRGQRMAAVLQQAVLLIFAYVEVAPVPGVVDGAVVAEVEVAEEVFHPHVVRRLLELEVAAVLEVLLELGGVAFAEFIDRRVELTLEDLLELVRLGGGLQVLPGEVAAEEVHEEVADAFEVVAPALFWSRTTTEAEVAVDADEARGAGHGAGALVLDVQARARIAVPLR